jgi:hypothetical protein
MISNREAAKLVSDTLQRMKGELREVHRSVEESCPPDEFAAFNRGLRRILHHFDEDILGRLYQANPDLAPHDWPREWLKH